MVNTIRSDWSTAGVTFKPVLADCEQPHDQSREYKLLKRSKSCATNHRQIQESILWNGEIKERTNSPSH